MRSVLPLKTVSVQSTETNVSKQISPKKEFFKRSQFLFLKRSPSEFFSKSLAESLSKYLSKSWSKSWSKSVHVLTIFVYLFTFLGPSVALATQGGTQTLTQTLAPEEESFVVSPQPPKAASACQDFPEEQVQKEQYLNISQGYGPQSLFFGIGKDIQYFVSSVTLSEGDLPYREVKEKGVSLGFGGTLPHLGGFFCAWDGDLFLQGDEQESSLASPSLVLDTFAPVTFSNFMATAVKTTAKRIFFRGENKIQGAILTPMASATPEDLEAFCQIIAGSSLKVKDLTLTKGEMANLGCFEGEKVSISRQSSLMNAGRAHINNLQGQGLFLNHGLFEGLKHLSIERFINQNKSLFAPQAEARFDDVFVAASTTQFLNDEDALLNVNKITFENRRIMRAKDVSNKGHFLAKDMTLNGRDFVNGGEATFVRLNLHKKAALTNKEGQTISGVRVLKISQGSTINNKGTFETQGGVAHDIFKILANQEQGHWNHEGDVELAERKTTIIGSVSLRKGRFINGNKRNIFNKGTLTLDAFFAGEGDIALHNESKMTVSGLSGGKHSHMSIFNAENASLLMTDNAPSLSARHSVYNSVYNSGKLRLSSTNRLTYNLLNGFTGSAYLEEGAHLFNLLENEGNLQFAKANWGVEKSSSNGALVFTSVGSDFVSLEDPAGDVSTYSFTTSSSIFFPQDLTVSLPFALAHIDVGGNLYLPLLDAFPRTLEDLKNVTCHGETHIALKELTLTADLTLEKLSSLHITCSEAIKIQARLQAPELFLNGLKGFDLGTDNTHFGDVVATAGRLGITVQEALNAKYGRLHSMQKMRLRSKGDRVDIGEMVLTDPDVERWLGYTHNSVGNVATTKFYTPNGSMISSPSFIHIIGKKAVLTGAKFYTGRDLIFTCEQDVNIITSILEGQGKCVFDTPKTSIRRKDKKNIHIRNWGCDNDCKYEWKTYGDAIMSDQAVVNFKEEIDFRSQEVFLSSCALHAGTDIKHLEGSNQVVEVLTETSALMVHGCKRHKRRRHYRHNPTTSKTYPTVVQSGQEITMALGHGSFVGLNLNTQHFTFRAQTGSFKNPTTHRHTVEQVAIEVDLPTYLRELTRQGATMMRLEEDGGISPVFPMAGTSTRNLNNLPVVCTQPWQSLEDSRTFNPLENVPLEMLMQRAMGRFAGQLHMGGLSGGRLFNQIYRNSRDFSTKHANEESDLTQLTYYRGALQESPVPLLYYISKLVDSRKEVHLQLHIPGTDVNPYQEAGDVSATDIEMETVEDLSYEGTRIVGKNDVLMTSTQGAVDRRGYVDRQGEREFAGCSNEVISTEGSVITRTKTGISDRHSKIKAKEDIVQKTDGTIFQGTNIVHDHTHDGKTTRDTVTHLQSEFEAKRILVEGARIIDQAPIMKAKKQIHYKSQKGIGSHSATNSAHEETHRKKKKALGGSSSRDEVIHMEDVLRPEYHAPHVVFETQENDISLEAPLIRTKVLEFKAPEGKLVLKAALQSFLHSTQTTKSSFAWNKMVNKGETSTTIVGADIEAEEFLFDLKRGIEYSLRSDQQAAETNFHGALKKQKNVIWHALQDESDSWYDVQESIGGPLALVISIAVTCMTAGSLGPIVAGMATSLGFAAGGTAAAVFTASTTAALSSLASQSAVSFISNKGNVGKVFKDLTSSQALRSLAVSIVVAGLSAGACEALSVETASKVELKNAVLSKAGKATVAQSFAGRAHEVGIRAAAQTSVRSTLGKEDFGTSLLGAARFAAADVVGGYAANKVGGEYKLDESVLNYVTHKLAHGIIGAGMGALSNNKALSGAIGATVAEIIGEGFAHLNPEAFDPTHTNYDPSKRPDLTRNGTALAEISAATVAAFLGQDPNTAAHTANNAVTENSFAVVPVLVSALEAAGATALIVEGYDALKLAVNTGVAYFKGDDDTLDLCSRRGIDLLSGQVIGLATGYGLSKIGLFAAPYARTLWTTYGADTSIGRSLSQGMTSFSRGAVQEPYLLTADRIIPAGYHLRYLNNNTPPLVIRNPGQALFLDQLSLQGGKPIKIFDIKQATSKIHGNTRTSNVEATLYAKFDKKGKFEKWGISKDPDSRYSKKEMADGELRLYRTGPRDQMLDTERKLTERFPGPKNKEPWAGTKNPEKKGL